MAVIKDITLYVPDPQRGGRPLFFGQIYVGQPDLDPEIPANQKQLRVKQEDGTLVNVLQPFVLSAGGVPVYNGSPVTLDVVGDYSIKTLDSNGQQAYYDSHVVADTGGGGGEVDLIPDLSQEYIFDTVAAYKAFATAFPVGKRIYIKDRMTHYVVIAGTGAANDIDILGSIAVDQSIELDKRNEAKLSDFGAVEGGDATQAYIKAATFLLSKEYPGGTIHHDGRYNITAGQVNFWDILAAEQGITPADNYLPNGDLVRGTYIAIRGDGYERSKAFITGAGDGFVWGNFTAINSKRAMSGHVSGIDFQGDGAVGHTSQLVIDNGSQSYSTITNASAGTTNTTTRALVFEECVPNAFVTNCRFRYFQEAIHQTYGFGFDVSKCDIQFCNYGAFFDVGVTTSGLGAGNEIELCAVPIFMKNTSNCYIKSTISEANIAGADLLVWISKFLSIDGMWNEGSPLSIVAIGDQTAPSLPNSGWSIKNVVGLNIDSNGGMVNLHVQDCAMNLTGEAFAVNSGEQFRNIIYNNCTFSEGYFDASSVTVSGIASYDEIKIKGKTINGTTLDFASREPLVKRAVQVASSNVGNNTCFTLEIDNEDTTGRIEITGYWKTDPANDYQMYTFKYVGVISREAGNNSVVTFLANESISTLYPSTGTNVPNLPTLPNTTVSLGTGGTQEVTVEFALGTAVSQTADTFYTATIDNQTDGIRYK